MSFQSITNGLDHHPLALAYIFKFDSPLAQNQWFFALLDLPRSIIDLDWYLRKFPPTLACRFSPPHKRLGKGPTRATPLSLTQLSWLRPSWFGIKRSCTQ
ncbi:hypothetical protein WR25_20242 [Diploscapter pachys]|uniref:Uncharacterized protein n=1 Tax=Diploscapter pachys TaxID=2018661 RepID=A0A2A2LPI2_9BILA|nr:hypothetical protein WR25_20242 [Diploscapter pachys]